MSKHSLEVAEAAQKDKSLLGTTNSTRSSLQEQPHTASKVEKSAVQSGETEHENIVGNTNNKKAISEEFKVDEDTTKARTEKVTGSSADYSNTDSVNGNDGSVETEEKESSEK